MLNQEQREYLLTKAYNAALRAGSRILDIYNNSDDYVIDIKSDHTPITLADREAHTLIKEYLGQTRIPLLSEEGRDLLYEERRRWDLFWMVDPLDGTKEFLKGNGEFTINIALMSDNQPVIGVIYVPYIQKIYFSDREIGAFRKEPVAPDAKAEYDYATIFDQAVRLPLTQESNNPPVVAISRSHNTDETFAHIFRFKKQYPKAQVIEQGSSYKLCLIAEGSVDYYPRTSFTYEWDTAAGQAIIEAAGGTICELSMDQEGEALTYNKLSLHNPNFVCRNKFMIK